MTPDPYRQLAQCCRTCGVEKPLDEFWRQSNRRNGRQSECIVCMRPRTARWAANNKARRIALSTKSRASRPVRFMFQCARWRARKKGIDFTITLDDIVVPEFCPVLGLRLEFGLGKARGLGRERDNAPSIDRIDNSKGYVPGNVAIISWRANAIKGDASFAEILALAEWCKGHASAENPGAVGDTTAERGRAQLQDDMPGMLLSQEEAK